MVRSIGKQSGESVYSDRNPQQQELQQTEKQRHKVCIKPPLLTCRRG